MGQKIHPTGFRIATIEPWRSRWYGGKKDFGKFLLQDFASTSSSKSCRRSRA
jgi:small subunit ribosomal protein S3